MPKQIRHWMGLVWKKCPLSSVRSPWYNTNITSASICSSQSTIESTVWTLNHDKVMTKFKRTYVLSAECFYRKDLDFFHFWRSHTFSQDLLERSDEPIRSLALFVLFWYDMSYDSKFKFISTEIFKQKLTETFMLQTRCYKSFILRRYYVFPTVKNGSQLITLILQYIFPSSVVKTVQLKYQFWKK